MPPAEHSPLYNSGISTTPVCSPRIYSPGPAACEVITNQQIADHIWEMTFSWQHPVNPGSFVSILPSPAGSFILRRPLSIADQDIDANTLTVIYRVVGAGTKALSHLQAGEKIDVLGPLGNGFPTEYCQLQTHYPHLPNMPTQALLIGGGVGIPPLYLLAKQLVEAHITVEFHLGMRQGSEVFWEKKFAQLGTVKWTTEDGSLGVKGNVSHLDHDLVNLHLLAKATNYERTQPPILTNCPSYAQPPSSNLHPHEQNLSNSLPNMLDNDTTKTDSTDYSLDTPLPADLNSRVVYACGPAPMLRYVQQTWGDLCPTYLSLEERMACSTGACYACVTPSATDATKQFRVCFDGPVFCAHEVKI